MRRVSFLMTLFFFTVCSAMQISTDRQVYSPLEEGVLTVSIDVPTQYQGVIIEIEIFDAFGNMVYGDVMHSQIPQLLTGQGIRETHTNVSWQEVPEDGMIYREFPFTVPATAVDGEYTVVARVLYQDSTIDSAVTNMSVVGSIPVLGGFEIIFIVALIVAVIIWKEV